MDTDEHRYLNLCLSVSMGGFYRFLLAIAPRFLRSILPLSWNRLTVIAVR